jgi:hypothetical protein
MNENDIKDKTKAIRPINPQLLGSNVIKINDIAK